LFNAQSKGDSLDLSNADYASPVIAGKGQSQEINVSVAGGKQLVLFVKDGGDGFDHDHAYWANPVLKGPKGELSLTDLKWTYADAGWGTVNLNRTVENQPYTEAGKEIPGIGTHSVSKIIYTLPEGYDSFSVKGVVTDTGSVVFGVLVDRSTKDVADFTKVTVNFKDLGISGAANVRDLWAHKDLGSFTDSFGQELPLHGAGLYRISPAK